MEELDPLNQKIALQYGNIQMLVLVFFLATVLGVFYSIGRIQEIDAELQQYKEAIKNPEAATPGYVHNN